MTPNNKQGNEFDPVVHTVIHEWDPFHLLRGGAPPDEWDHEIQRIVERLNSIKTPRDCAVIISEVFTHAFHPVDFGVEDCKDVGQQLFDALQKAGLCRQ